MRKKLLIWLPILIAIISYWVLSRDQPLDESRVIQPITITQKANYDTDDPAIWYNEEDPSSSLILGTDKGKDGFLFVYDLNGKILKEKTVKGLNRPNNVDVKHVNLNGRKLAIAAVTERGTNKLRIFSVPEMEPIDQGGIEVFEGEEQKAPMGIALYIRQSDEAAFAIVSRKSGPSGSYLWQYRLDLNSDGKVIGEKVREFGKFSGIKEIEAIAVDDEMGYVYYSDEQFGVRKYFADPDMGNEELAVFAQKGFTEDHEGISIYKVNSQTGYILVSDQKAGKFHIFTREGTYQNPHKHELVKIVHLATKDSDGSEVVSLNLGTSFPNGLFVAMSTDKTFHYYDWRDIAGNDLKLAETDHDRNEVLSNNECKATCLVFSE